MIDEFEFLEKIRKTTKVERKIESEVFEKNVLSILIHLIENKYISSINFPISKGKEAYVFRAEKGKRLLEKFSKKSKSKSKFAAIKIYMIETSRFKHMQNYIKGDPRFRKIPHTKKEIVYEWTKKEFRNLRLCHEAGISVPEPYYFKNNVLVIDFIGDDYGNPAPQLKKVGPPDPKKNFKQLIRDMKKMYEIGLVHGDLSEYNILVNGDSLVIIDVGQTVSKEHPMAEEFLERDVNNLIRYFSEFGIKANKEDIIKEIKSAKRR
jgi:RIO kinase 1